MIAYRKQATPYMALNRTNPAHSIQYKELLSLYWLSLDQTLLQTSKNDALLPVIVLDFPFHHSFFGYSRLKMFLIIEHCMYTFFVSR